MGALIAVVDKADRDAFATATAMLDALGHRGSASLGVASCKRVIVRKTLDGLLGEKLVAAALVGRVGSTLHPSNETSILHCKHCTFVLEGRLFPPQTGEEARFVAAQAATESGAARFIQEHDGSYAFAANTGKGIVVGRDVVGTRPLYFGESETVCAVASERKALWNIGVTAVSPFLPGTLALVDKRGFHFETAKTIRQPPVRKTSLQNAASRLEEVLIASTGDQVTDVKDVAVAFSGGLDSCVIAHSARLCGARVHLICVSLTGTREADFAEDAADDLGLPLHTAEYPVGKVEDTLANVLWLIEEPNPLSASIAMPLFWVAEQAAGLGLHVLLSGHGGDELFGGYARYLEDYESSGTAGLKASTYRDVLSSHEVNFARDEKVCAFHKVDLRMPFNCLKVIELALSLPVRLNVSSPRDKLRKRVLRQTAKNWGFPESVSEKPKKAIQYATGVNQALRRLAAKEGLTLREYVEKVFKRAYHELGEDG